MHTLLRSRVYICLELAIIAFAIPVLMIGHIERGAIFTALWIMALYCGFIYRRLLPNVTARQVWDGAALRDWSLWKPILKRFAVSALAMTALLFAVNPEKFLELPTERTLLWCMVMVFYPTISVIPQEFIFRSFFMERYKLLFAGKWPMIAASAVTFGFAHIVLQNWIAVALTAVGGYYFASTYHKRPSMALVWAEHALYGCFIFTIGLGFYFYSGAPHKW